MQLEKIAVVAKREYTQRIRSKGFWIATLILPVFVMAAIFLPSYILSRSRADQRVVVVDPTDRVARRLLEQRPEKPGGDPMDKVARFKFLIEPPAAGPQAQQAQKAALDRQVLDKQIDAWIWI
ncbi:MAG: hypothetical protein ABUL63_01825, partial [Acidobacteriota bacterium]